MDAVDYFKFVRDIPYKISTTLDEPDYSCSGKHKILYQLLSSIKLKVRYRVCEFLWEDVNLPKKVKKIPHENSCTHTYLEVFVPKRKWVVVDATWDKKLSKNFKINDWGGKNDTPIAVKTTKIYSPETSKKFVESESTKDIENDFKINGAFYEAINNWLEDIRTNSPQHTKC